MSRKRLEDKMEDYVKDNGLSVLYKDTNAATIKHMPLDSDIPRAPRVPIDPYEELRMYLEEKGLPFKTELMGGKDASVEREFKKFLDEGKTPEDFYRESETYLYHLTHLETDVWSQPYRWIIREVLPPPRTMLDFGCGTGANGLYFQAYGYDVSFADYESRCTDFLKWRLKLRELDRVCYNIQGEEIPQQDIAIAFDVIEHVPDPFTVLKQLERAGKIVAMNLLTKIPKVETDLPQLHYNLDIDKIMEYLRTEKKIITERDLDYAIYVIYESAGK